MRLRKGCPGRGRRWRGGWAGARGAGQGRARGPVSPLPSRPAPQGSVSGAELGGRLALTPVASWRGAPSSRKSVWRRPPPLPALRCHVNRPEEKGSPRAVETTHFRCPGAAGPGLPHTRGLGAGHGAVAAFGISPDLSRPQCPPQPHGQCTVATGCGSPTMPGDCSLSLTVRLVLGGSAEAAERAALALRAPGQEGRGTWSGWLALCREVVGAGWGQATCRLTQACLRPPLRPCPPL